MSGGEIVSVVAIVVLIAIAAFLAASETALTRINKVKAATLAEEGHKRAATLEHLAQHPERTINPILFLVLACHLAASFLLGILAESTFGGIGVVIAYALEVGVIFVLAEAAPKTWAIQNTERAALGVAPIVSLIGRFPPLRLLTTGLIGLSNVILPGKGLKRGPFISEEELLALADQAEAEDVIEREERALIHSIIEFGDTVVREVMVPRPDMVSVEARAAVSDVMEVAIQAGYSRIPVFEQGIDDIVGVAYVKDLMRAARDDNLDQPVRGVMRDARFVPETKRVAELMREMQAEKFHMAVVFDEYSGTAGLVTLEDLIEELVGEIVDEFDVEEPLVERVAGGDVRVSARMPVDELNDLLQTDLPEGDWDTVGGLLYHLLGHVPSEGECADHNGQRLRAEKIQGRRIGRVRIGRLPEPADEPAAEPTG